MSIISFFATYGEVIIGVTLILLLATYWVLIYQIKKLERTMSKFDGRFVKLEELFRIVKDRIVTIGDVIGKFELIKSGVLKFSAKTPIGPIDAEISLAQLTEKKRE